MVALAIIFFLWLCKNNVIFNDKSLLLSRSATGAVLCSVHGRSSAYGEPRTVYGGLYTVGGYGEGFYYLTWVAA
jgi:hypothetical protein